MTTHSCKDDRQQTVKKPGLRIGAVPVEAYRATFISSRRVHRFLAVLLGGGKGALVVEDDQCRVDDLVGRNDLRGHDPRVEHPRVTHEELERSGAVQELVQVEDSLESVRGRHVVDGIDDDRSGSGGVTREGHRDRYHELITDTLVE